MFYEHVSWGRLPLPPQNVGKLERRLLDDVAKRPWVRLAFEPGKCQCSDENDAENAEESVSPKNG